MGRRLLLQGELIPFPVSKLGKHTDTLSRKEEAEKLAREAVKAGETERLEKDGVIVYKPKADVSVRIDIKNK